VSSRKYPAPTHHPQRNPQESNLLQPGFNRSLIPMSLSPLAWRTGGVEPPPRGRRTTRAPATPRPAVRRRPRRRRTVSSHGTTVQLSKGSRRTRIRACGSDGEATKVGGTVGRVRTLITRVGAGHPARWTTTAQAGAPSAPPRELTESHRPVARMCWSHAIRPRQARPRFAAVHEGFDVAHDDHGGPDALAGQRLSAGLTGAGDNESGRAAGPYQVLVTDGCDPSNAGRRPGSRCAAPRPELCPATQRWSRTAAPPRRPWTRGSRSGDGAAARRSRHRHGRRTTPTGIPGPRSSGS
jgi:hypothetical protein